MNTNRGIFDSLPQPGAASPFAAVNDPAPATGQPVSPFAAISQKDSPFAIVEEAGDAFPVEPGKPARLPERRPSMESPFQLAESPEPFGFEAVGAAPAAFGTPPASPFAIAQPTAVPSPFTVEPAHEASGFGTWPPSPAPAPFYPVAKPPPAPAPMPAAFAAPPAAAPEPIRAAPEPQRAAPAPQQAADPAASVEISWANTRQIELRAIFGVDREMSIDEILQRSRSLSGIRQIARIGNQELSAIESLKQTFINLGFGSGGLKVAMGSVPIEFIREGGVLLAVQTNGGFAPGVRETLMLVARELDRMA
jgi:hypothetical protein